MTEQVKRNDYFQLPCPKCGERWDYFDVDGKVRLMCPSEAEHAGYKRFDDPHAIPEMNKSAGLASFLIVGFMVLLILAILGRLIFAVVTA